MSRRWLARVVILGLLLGGGHQIQVQAIHLQAGDDVALMGH